PRWSSCSCGTTETSWCLPRPGRRSSEVTDRHTARSATTSQPTTGQPSRRGTGPLSGTRTLVRFMLRRDRIKLPAWVGGLGLFVIYIGAALPQLAPTEKDLVAAVQMLEQPIGRMFAGPGYGLDSITYERF